MLSKKILLATVLITCLFFVRGEALGGLWLKVEIKTLINEETYLSAERWRLSPYGVEIVNIDAPGKNKTCYTVSLRRFLEQKIVGKTLKIKFPTPVYPRQLYREAIIKFGENYDLSEFLLREGWAQIKKTLNTAPKEYVAAQRYAQKQRKGLWGECDNWYKLREGQRLQGKTLYLAPEYRSFLRAGSSGWVKRLIEPNIWELQNGLQIKLQGLKVPTGKSKLDKCWRDEVMKALNSLVLGKKILLEPDQLQLTTKGQQLQRYVWLPRTRWKQAVLLNAYIITEGLMQLEPADLQHKYLDEMNEAARISKNKSSPPGWWGRCSAEILEVASNAKNTQSLDYDEACPIKGNVAGSKKNPKKTYHTPLSSWYERLEYEECFKDEASAEAAGFTKVK